LVITGSYNAWILVGSVSALFGTPYGKLLLIKLSLLLPLLGVAAVNLLRHKPKITDGSQARSAETALRLRKLTRNVIIEAALGMVILLIVGHMGVTPPARHVQPEWPFSLRWDWSALENAPRARAEVERGAVWGAVGAIALLSALARRRRRILAATTGFAALGYAINIVHTAISIDAYPTTYRRPAVAYHAISVANGKIFYQDSGCIVCHGPYGYGDGLAAQELSPKPADLTAPHANTHTAGDLFWWLSYGVTQSSAMPGYSQSLSEEELWDLINFLRASSSGEQARNLAPIIEDEPRLVAPDFTYGTDRGDVRALKDHRGSDLVLLVFCSLPNSLDRLRQLRISYPRFRAARVELLLVPIDIQDFESKSGPVQLGLPVVTEGGREIFATYALFARSFADDRPSELKHVEFLIDKQGYIRARWLPDEGEAWRKIDVLMRQIELLQREKPRAPAPDEHVH
jgi:putative copper resistance protein D